MEDQVEELELKPVNVRRTFTLRNNVARHVAVNFMPSRQLPYGTLRLRRTISESNVLLETNGDESEKQADIIVREMEQNQRLMEDNPVSEELRREALRDLPQGLTMKRNVRAKLSASVSLRSKHRPISMTKRLKYRLSFAWKKARDHISEFIFSIELWYEAIRHVEGHFGSAVGSYFYFLRWLFALNAALAVLLVCLVVVPQTLHDERANRTGNMGFLEFISGKGGFEDSLLFYGHYHSGDVATPGPFSYNMPFAYFFTMLCLYFLFFALLCYRTAYSYRRNFIETAGGLSNIFATKVFCGWDFGIVSHHAAALNASSIYNEFKELLSEQNRKRVNKSFCTKLGHCFANVVVTALVLGFVLGLEFGLWRLLVLQTDYEYWELVVSLTVTLVVAVCPILFNLIVKLEYYKPRTAFYVTLARTGLLDVGTLTLLFFYWAKSGTECWESSMGQEAYRLVVLDALVSLFLLPIVEFARGFIFKLNPNTSPPEFNIAYNSLTLIYNQAVLWYGMLFSPLLPVAVTIKFLLLFYVKRECALRACQPARKVWRAAQTQTVQYMLVTISLFVTLFAVGSLFVRGSSHHCGPFREYEAVYSIVSVGVLRLEHHEVLRRVLAFLARPGFIAFVFLSLCVAMYFMRAKARAQRSMVEILRRMLLLQAKDKDFLLSAIDKVSNGEWLYSPRAEDQGTDSHTWKYLQDVRKPSNAGYHFDPTRLNHSMIERPRSYVKEIRPNSYHMERRKSSEDGETDSSFSWQGSGKCLNDSPEE
ncbi:transmembrane channel-like protein 6 [Battus philenor]|uniref:transmembrane channel-like protein 6 n=1 Tax=Battus philenor TaxID=42288 RepID=UPI0035CFA2E6